MPYSIQPHRAELRSEALLDSWARSLEHVRSLAPEHPVVPLPSEPQALLEGAVCHELGTLFCPTDSEGTRHLRLTGFLEMTRIRAERDRLLLDVVPHGVARTLAMALFPWHEAGPGSPVRSPGMRLRAIPQGIEVFRPGIPGAVQFRGIGFEEVMARHRDYCPDGRCIAELSPRAVTAAEAELGYVPTRGAALALSAVVRRLGILCSAGAGAESIHSWEALVRPRGTIAVEVSYPQLDQAVRESIIARLASPHLSPRWVIGPWIGRSGEPIGSRFHVRSPGNHTDIQLRLVGPIGLRGEQPGRHGEAS